MKKQNVIDLAAYREKRQRLAAEALAKAGPSPVLAISDELKSAIETLIVKLRATDAAD